MSGIIHLLPDSVANQIAAGEVIQRPASVVKELVENAVDSGADSITVNIRESGKTSIQVIDNGCGMSETDARLCWERHATSKIASANDLFSIKTKGFRGEALASIAAISEVNLKTRRHEEELGTEIRITASEIQSNEPAACQKGSNFIIKNLFFNVPARRKFLKSNSTEFRHIINEFTNIALAHTDIQFKLIHNDTIIYHLPSANPRQRILAIYGKTLHQNLIPVESGTDILTIKGFIGKPEHAKKKFGEQFFFVNGRYMRHPYFHKAIMKAYDNILQPETIPSYFIFFGIDSDRIDINIHPTKTEVKFEDDRIIWQILNAVIKESIGKYNLSPSIDFDTNGVIDIPTRKDLNIKPPGINVNPAFNPFEEENRKFDKQSEHEFLQTKRSTAWETMYQNDWKEPPHNIIPSREESGVKAKPENHRFLQIKNKYILSPVKSGLMLIDQKRAHERILYEQTLYSLKEKRGIAQKSLFPESIELNASDFVMLKELLDDLNNIGFDIRIFGRNTIVVNGIPETVKNSGLHTLIEEMIGNYKLYQADPKLAFREKLAKSVARASAIPYGKILETVEMRELVDQLFACSDPSHSPTGKKIINIINTEDLEKIFN